MAAPIKIALTGAAGLVGQNLIPRLKARGYSDIVALDKHKANIAILRQLHPDITVIEADLARRRWLAGGGRRRRRGRVLACADRRAGSGGLHGQQRDRDRSA